MPGSGKTLAGLEALHKIRNLENEGAVFVSEMALWLKF